ncbi:MAG TPA: glycosyltransferase family 4 protein [Vicinamibacteria bacterium]|nr:glycosyltransferase family 4 protein [Vicinamibacteria bacterium]
MRVLYVASDQVVPGRTGGSVHVLEVARGLAARGHEVDAVVDAASHAADEPRVRWHPVRWTPHVRFLRFRAREAVQGILREARPQVLMERYYNFGGEGIDAAAQAGVPSLLEVNSPVVDHPGSWKARLDALALVRPLRAHRERLCRQAAAIVSPLPEIVPDFARGKTATVTWGANVDAFHPDRRSGALRREWGVPEGATVVLFSGSFRPWHGVHVLEEAARRLRARADLFFVLAGGPRAGAATEYRGLALGSVPYERMPEVVASADIGVAPYDTSRLAQLQLGFFWSPLKIFEYMASGLPAVTIPRAPLTEIVREGREGAHAKEADPVDLARVIASLADDADGRARMGSSARTRVVERYSWARHCEQLEGVLQGLLA